MDGAPLSAGAGKEVRRVQEPRLAVPPCAGARARFDGDVVLATSGYDWDDDLAHDFLGLKPADRGSVAPRTLTGDGIRLARQAGAAVVEIPANRVPVQVG